MAAQDSHATAAARRRTLPHPDPDEARRLLEVLQPMLEPLRRAIPGNAEVVLHDFTKLPNSIVAIAGNVTGRTVGSPATDSLLRDVARGEVKSTHAHDLRLPGGRELRSTNIVLRDSAGTPAYALSINVDLTLWRAVQALATSMLPAAPAAPAPEASDEATNDVAALRARLLDQAIATVGVRVGQMAKRHKLAVVEHLKGRGFFLIKDSVEDAARTLAVTRFTIYNYLNELDATPDADPRE